MPAVDKSSAMAALLPDAPTTLAEFRSLGVPNWRVQELVEERLLRRVLRGVYVAATVEDSVALRVRAATKVIPPGVIVRDRTAAFLHGVEVLGYAETEVLPPLETCVLPGKEPPGRAGVDGRQRDLLPRDLVVLEGLTVTSPLRTALDLGCHLKRWTAFGALDAMRHEHALSLADFDRELPRFRGRRGVRQLRELLPMTDPRAESMRESWTRLVLLEEGFPPPELQWWIELAGIPTWRLDLAYPRHRIAIEYDGEEWHDRTEEQWENDDNRRAWLRQHGWIVIVVKKADLSPTGPNRWLDEVAASLAKRRVSTMRPFMHRGQLGA